MAIQYTSILLKIKDLLDAGLVDAVVEIEPAEFDASPKDTVAIYLARESCNERTVSSSDPYLSILEVSVLCVSYSPNGAYEASKKRDELVGNVRDILKTNRSLDGLCDTTQLGDIEFETAQSEVGFLSAATLTLRVFVTS